MKKRKQEKIDRSLGRPSMQVSRLCHSVIRMSKRVDHGFVSKVKDESKQSERKKATPRQASRERRSNAVRRHSMEIGVSCTDSYVTETHRRGSLNYPNYSVSTDSTAVASFARSSTAFFSPISQSIRNRSDPVLTRETNREVEAKS